MSGARGKVSGITGRGVLGAADARGWFERAQPGDTLVYARVEHLPPKCLTAEELRLREARGDLYLFRRRVDGSLFSYEAQRSSRGFTVTGRRTR